MIGDMEQQKGAFEEEKAMMIHAQARFQVRLKGSMEHEGEITWHFTTYQTKVKAEKNQWMVERGALYNQIEELQAQEHNLNDMIDNTQL